VPAIEDPRAGSNVVAPAQTALPHKLVKRVDHYEYYVTSFAKRVVTAAFNENQVIQQLTLGLAQ
jgi:hypothetical protein